MNKLERLLTYDEKAVLEYALSCAIRKSQRLFAFSIKHGYLFHAERARKELFILYSLRKRFFSDSFDDKGGEADEK